MADSNTPQPVATPPDSRPWLTLSEAARACGVDRSTIRRALDAGKFPQARREAGPSGPMSGAWRVPIDDLLQAGYRPGKPSPPEDARHSGADAPPQVDATPEVERLRDKVAELRRRAEVAEAVAAERGRHIGNLEVALRALPAGAEHPRLGWRQRRRLAKEGKGAQLQH